MENYTSIITAINKGIREFSEYLHSDHYFSLIDNILLSDKKIAWNLTEVHWNDTQFPGDNKGGVYFIFGRKKFEQDFIGVYVGKASLESKIGNRLHKHLNNPLRDNKIYQMKDKTGNEFLLEFVVTIPMEEAIVFLAPALEEYIICNLQNQNIYLINAVGKQ